MSATTPGGLVRHLITPVLYLAALLATAPAQALSVRCVGTAQELRDALVEVATIPDDVLIKIRLGNYAADDADGAFQLASAQPNQTVTLSGGWAMLLGSCSLNFQGSDGTHLSGTVNAPALYVYANGAAAKVVVKDLSLHNPDFADSGLGSCLSAFTQAGRELLVERVTVSQCDTSNSAVSANISNDSGSVVLRDVVVAGNLAAGGSAGLSVVTYGTGVTKLAQLSIAGNMGSTASPAGGLYIGNFGSAEAWLTNSLAWGNAAGANSKDVHLWGPNIHLSRVHYGSLGGTAPADNLTPGTGDPRIVSLTDPRPRPDSVLVDSGVANPQGSAGAADVRGQARLVGPALDVGAYELDEAELDVIFAHAFE